MRSLQWTLCGSKLPENVRLHFGRSFSANSGEFQYVRYYGGATLCKFGTIFLLFEAPTAVIDQAGHFGNYNSCFSEAVLWRYTVVIIISELFGPSSTSVQNNTASLSTHLTFSEK